MAALLVNDMLVKLTAQRYPLGEVITVRGVIATLMVAHFLGRQADRGASLGFAA